MPRHSNFAEILRLSSQICADGMAWKRNFFFRQQRTLDSLFIFSLGNGCGPEKNQNLSQFNDHFHNTKASRLLAVSRFSVGMSRLSHNSQRSNLVPRACHTLIQRNEQPLTSLTWPLTVPLVPLTPLTGERPGQKKTTDGTTKSWLRSGVPVGSCFIMHVCKPAWGFMTKWQSCGILYSQYSTFISLVNLIIFLWSIYFLYEQLDTFYRSTWLFIWWTWPRNPA